MCDYKYITLREKPEIMETAATWFHSKWHVPREAYLECMMAYLSNDTEYGWYLLLNMAVEDLRSKGISPVYLLTNHIGFYERYGWEFLCMAQGDGEPYLSRMYIHQ